MGDQIYYGRPNVYCQVGLQLPIGEAWWLGAFDRFRLGAVVGIHGGGTGKFDPHFIYYPNRRPRVGQLGVVAR